MSRTTSRRYERPHRPRAIRLLDGAGRALSPLGLGDGLDEASLLDAARKRAGARFEGLDFEDLGFLEPLRVLLDSMREEARLTPTGRLIQRTRLVDALVTRLRLERYERAHPDVLDRPLGPVLVIAGLQRTGTTMLHRLLAADPATRALLAWEALNPIPLEGERPGQPTRRQRQAKLAQHALSYLAPDFFAVHPVEFGAPEEDVLLLDLAFMSQTPEAIMHVPSYSSWLEQQDHAPAYRMLRRVMRVLLAQRPGRRWVLKTPHHMEHLETLLEVFPEAKIIQTHRDPAQTMPSFCSMVAHGRGVFSDEVDPHEVARHWLRKVRRMGERALAARAALTPEEREARFLDVAYQGLLDDPMAEVERVYRFLGEPRTDEARRAMEATRARNVRHKYGRHRYALRDFGLTAEDIDRELGFLRDAFSIPRERALVTHHAGDGAVGATGVGHGNAVSATLTGVLDLFSQQARVGTLRPEARMDGRTVLVTGANSGLGRAIATQLAARGARLILACRSGIPETAEAIVAETGNPDVTMLHVDLADLSSVHALCDTLAERGVVLDVAILNAGLMPRAARASVDGYEVMFAVHVLANRVLLARWLEDGVLCPRAAPPLPRVIFVSSEAHRSAAPVDYARFGAFVDYGVRDGMAQYASTKLQMCTLASELARRLAGDDAAVVVHAMCPGPVASNIAREAPGWVQPTLSLVMRRLFRSPDVAAEPALYLACAEDIEGETGRYLHMMRDKAMSPMATDPENGRELWERSEPLLNVGRDAAKGD